MTTLVVMVILRALLILNDIVIAGDFNVDFSRCSSNTRLLQFSQ